MMAQALQNDTPNDPPDMNCGTIWHRFWKVLGLILEADFIQNQARA